ncbi:MAG TPA: type VI secretion system tip protein TssI/VgrG [Candidatus Bathyarchaeia archaeon]|nr:type VI secretion system tip protein TssI/VgrG [Candidatus Bathyarchaeia archaeon]
MAGTDVKNVLLSIDSPLREKLVIRSFTGQEAISHLFSFQLDLVSTDTAVNFDDIVGKNVTIGVKSADRQSERLWNGYISRFVQLPDDEKNLANYRAEMVPWLWFLTRQADCRIFQDATVPDIIADVFAREQQSGYLDMRVKSSDYRKWEYCVQYRETTCNFVMRLMEQEGMFFFFTHEKGQHKMVIADQSTKIDSCQSGAIHFAPLTKSGGKLFKEAVTQWQMQQEVRTGKYTINDFNFKDSASTLLKVTSEAKHGGDSRWEIYDYPGEFDTHDEGVALADIYMDAEELPHKTVSGASESRVLKPGLSFELTGHPRSDQNGSYLLTSVNHSAFESGFFSDDSTGGGSYDNGFICIPIAVPYRPARITPKPLMQGSQTATVVVKKGEEILTDKYGRVKVRFHWDRETQRKNKDIPDEERSCFIRVSQPWAGTNWGSVWLPRVGQEVIVDFLEGDPDQPIITGRVYNDKNMPPWTLPDNQTQSGFKSRSTPKGSSSNYNEIRFEDKKGSELLSVHAELNKTETVEADSVEHIGHDRKLIVENDQKEHVKNNKHLHVDGDHKVKIDGSYFHHVKVDRAEKTDTGWSHDCGGAIQIKSGNEICFEAPEQFSIKVGGNFIVLNAAGIFIQGTMVMINSGGVPGICVPFGVEDPEDPDPPQGGAKGS